jgi:hypothetical protein
MSQLGLGSRVSEQWQPVTANGYSAITRCRVCRRTDLMSVLDLGEQVLTGVFPKSRDAQVTAGPLQLVWCSHCCLVQLAHTYGAGEMYGDSYGYRSSLNQSMVRHLQRKIRLLEKLVALRPGDTVLDIGSNDATSLKAYTTPSVHRVGIDPIGSKLQEHYTEGICLVPDFFSAATYRQARFEPARIVTSIAMFYDLDDPTEFARQVGEVLASDGVWHFEQSYLPSMLRMCSYDTICHEHLEYYTLRVVKRILDEAGLEIIDVEMNAINGGSFAVTAARTGHGRHVNRPVIQWLLEQEGDLHLDTPRPFRDFEERVYRHRRDLTRLLHALVADGKAVFGYGASTKGNVVLQFCGIDDRQVRAIAEVNEEKFGCYTPGTGIPIVSEAEAADARPDYCLVLPWHFRDGIIQRETSFLERGGKMIFPFPEIEIV